MLIQLELAQKNMKKALLNNGYFNCKGQYGMIFKSRYSEESMVSFGTTSCDTLTLDGKTYFIGEGESAVDKDKTKTIATKLFVLNMLAKYMDKEKITEEIYKLYITCPPTSYANQKSALPSYLEGEYNIIHNSKEKTILIDEVIVFPETIMAYIANNSNKFKNDVIIIDIGGVTSNIAKISNGNYGSKDITSLTHGVLKLETNICEYLNSTYQDINLEIDSISNLLRKGLYIGDSEANIIETEQEAITKLKNEFVKETLRYIKQKGWSVNTSSVLVTGGGGELLIDNIKQCGISHAKLSRNPIFDNLLGLEILVNSRGE